MPAAGEGEGWLNGANGLQGDCTIFFSCGAFSTSGPGDAESALGRTVKSMVGSFMLASHLPKASFVVHTAHSARPLVARLKGATKAWRTPNLARNVAFRAAANWGPLSETIRSGNPWVANSCRNTLITAGAVVEGIRLTSTHFKKASTMTRKVWPLNGSA